MRRLPLLPSGGKTDLASFCVYPWNGGKRWPPRGEARADERFGKAFHAAAEALALVLEEIGEVPGDIESGVAWCADVFELTTKEQEHLQTLVDRTLEQLEADGAAWRRPEVVFAVNVETGEARIARDRRDRHEAERIAIADLVFERARDGMLVVREYKTGRGAKSKRAASAGQTRLVGFAAARAFGREAVRVELCHVDGDGHEVDAADFDELEFCVIEAEQQELVERLLAPPQPKPGPWCEGEFCPIKGSCPAAVAMVARLEREVLHVPLARAPSTPEEAGALRTAVQLVRAWADDAEQKWKSVAQRGPIPVGAGKVVIAQERQGDEELLESDEAFGIVAEELAALVVDGDELRRTEAQRAAYTLKHSKASLERGVRKALGAKPARGALGRARDRIFDRLRRAGCVRRGGKYVVFTEVPAAQLGAGAIDVPADGGST